jgi:intracellular septation protein
MKSWFKLFIELAPMVLFFFTYKFFGLIPATATMIISTIIVTIIDYVVYKKIAYMPLITTLILTIFGMLTIMSGDSTFIKIKPTVVNCTFALILLGGAILKKGLMQHLVGHAVKLTELNWIKFSTRWGLFFLFLAILNEIIWRNYSEEFWVTFKAFGMVPLSLIFMLSQLPFLYKNKIE